MSPEPYLIAHVVRGKPAFDIAHCMEDWGTPTDPGPWWLIPTSGHRAYPYWHLLLSEFSRSFEAGIPPQGWPDHYSINNKSTKINIQPKLNISLEDLGL